MRLFPRVSFAENIHIIDGEETKIVKSIDISPIAIKTSHVNILSEKVQLIFNIKNKKYSFKAKPIRYDNMHFTIFKFLEPLEKIAKVIGKFIESYVKEKNICPYCYENKIDNLKCNNCEMPLDFHNINLLEKLKNIKISDLLNESKNSKKISISNSELDNKYFLDDEVLNIIKNYADVDYPVLITGETGTGKTFTAKLIHKHSKRKNKPFVHINCAAIPNDLLESELFGYVKGAFTGADKDKKGLIEEAEGGTLFLDEIGELSLNAQAKLLKFLDEGIYVPLGSTKELKSDVRIIAATNQDLENKIKEGKFREDLYHRLNVLEIKLKPLRARKNILEDLIKYLIKKFSSETGKDIKGVTKEALDILMNYKWPGNFRELINSMKRAIVISDSDILDKNCFGNLKSKKENENIKGYLDQLEKDTLIKALSESKGNISKMARLLGVSRPTVYKLLQKYNIGKLDN